MAYRDHLITTMDQLESLYGEKLPTSMIKEIDHISEGYRKLIEAAPFIAVATSGPEGLDCSPKGDAAGFVRILDDRTLAIPDRPGNNRIDGFRNIVRDPRIALLFLIPGIGDTFRVNGTAVITDDEELLSASEVNGKVPRLGIVVSVTEAYTQCAKALIRSDLWNSDNHIERSELPPHGEILKLISMPELDVDEHERARAERYARGEGLY